MVGLTVKCCLLPHYPQILSQVAYRCGEADVTGGNYDF